MNNFDTKRSEQADRPQDANKISHLATKSSVWSPGYLSLLVCLCFSVLLIIYYLIHIKALVTLPADILMWAETNFVGDIIKLRTGAPIYTPPGDSNSLVYTPGAPILTYAISRLIGKPTSIAAWRVIQLGFIFCSALIAASCSRRLSKLAFPGLRIPFPLTWGAFSFLALFLAATSPNTNRFAHSLHADALALLVSLCCFWTMLFYLKAPSAKRILLMAICPAIGYFVKQFLLGWAVVMFVFLLLENPKQIKRLLFFTAITSCFILIVIGGCYWLWGDNYVFWTFKILGSRNQPVLSPTSFNISLPRMLDHTIRVWMEIAMGVMGGWLTLRENNIRRLGPLWASWLVLIALEAFSSGAGWGLLYHFGPGVVIGMIWTLSALSKIWPWTKQDQGEYPLLLNWARPAFAAAFVLTLYVALHVVPTADPNEARYWKHRPSPGVYAYIQEIEREFEGVPPDKVLLDIGNWVYLRHSVLAKDRAISLGDQPCSGMYENFDTLIGRIRNKAYDKILVHDLRAPFFTYDHALWPRPSGVRKALLENYKEVRTISLAGAKGNSTPAIQFTGPVSVLIPNTEVPSNENNVAEGK